MISELLCQRPICAVILILNIMAEPTEPQSGSLCLVQMLYRIGMHQYDSWESCRTWSNSYRGFASAFLLGSSLSRALTHWGNMHTAWRDDLFWACGDRSCATDFIQIESIPLLSTLYAQQCGQALSLYLQPCIEVSQKSPDAHPGSRPNLTLVIIFGRNTIWPCRSPVRMCIRLYINGQEYYLWADSICSCLTHDDFWTASVCLFLTLHGAWALGELTIETSHRCTQTMPVLQYPRPLLHITPYQTLYRDYTLCDVNILLVMASRLDWWHWWWSNTPHLWPS